MGAATSSAPRRVSIAPDDSHERASAAHGFSPPPRAPRAGAPPPRGPRPARPRLACAPRRPGRAPPAGPRGASGARAPRPPARRPPRPPARAAASSDSRSRSRLRRGFGGTAAASSTSRSPKPDDSRSRSSRPDSTSSRIASSAAAACSVAPIRSSVDSPGSRPPGNRPRATSMSRPTALRSASRAVRRSAGEPRPSSNAPWAARSPSAAFVNAATSLAPAADELVDRPRRDARLAQRRDALRGLPVALAAQALGHGCALGHEVLEGQAVDRVGVGRQVVVGHATTLPDGGWTAKRRAVDPARRRRRSASSLPAAERRSELLPRR